MGFSKSLAIAEQNRNEAREAIKLIEKVQFKLVESDCLASAEDLENAIQLIKKFSDKHQPELQRWK